MGIEVPFPVVNEASARLNFTNEGGIEGTTRFLKNITGMWLPEVAPDCLYPHFKEVRGDGNVPPNLLKKQSLAEHSKIHFNNNLLVINVIDYS